MDKENQESSTDGTEELPTPSFSNTGDSSTSDPNVSVSRLSPADLQAIEQIVDRKVQSTKDKRFAKIEERLGLRDGLLADLEAQGVTIPENVRTQMQIRDLQEQLTQRPQQPAQAGDNGMSSPRQAVTEAISELKKHGLDPNDAEFIAIARGNYKDRAAFDLAVSRHVIGKLTPATPASPATATQGPARSSAQDDGGKRFSDKYEAELAKIPRGNIDGIRKLRARITQEAKEAGYKITF